MNILQITAIGLITTLLVIIVKQQRPDIQMMISLAAGSVIFILLLGNIKPLSPLLKIYTKPIWIQYIFDSTVIGITYIAEFGSQICKDWRRRYSTQDRAGGN